MKVGDKAYIIESGRKVREVELVGVAGDGFIVKFVDTGGGICVNRSRLYKLEDLPKEGVEVPVEKKPEGKTIHYYEVGA